MKRFIETPDSRVPKFYLRPKRFDTVLTKSAHLHTSHYSTADIPRHPREAMACNQLRSRQCNGFLSSELAGGESASSPAMRRRVSHLAPPALSSGLLKVRFRAGCLTTARGRLRLTE